MIKLTKINLQFGSRAIITDGSLSIQNGRLCLIHSESGTGKTTLLNEIALLNDPMHCLYLMDDQDITALSTKERDELKLRKIAYMSQDTKLLDGLCVEDHLKWCAQINLIPLQQIAKTLKILGLEKSKHKKISKLSGGERQRVAFASCLLKDADLYIFDEPTSMLDEQHKKIVAQIIQQLVIQNKMVIVATHETEYFHDYDEYTIKDHTLVVLNEVKREPNSQEVPSRSKHSPKQKLYRSLAVSYLLNFPYKNAIFILLTSLCTSLMVLLLMAGFANFSEQTLNISDMYNSELLYVKKGHMQSDFNSDDNGNFALDKSTISKIEQLENVKSAEPYLWLNVPPRYYSLEKHGDYFNDHEERKVEVIQDNQVIATKYYDDFVVDTYIYFSEGTICIYPTYEHQKYNQRCEMVNDEDGVYISASLAKYLGIETLEGQSIRMKMGVVVAEEPCLVTYEDGYQEAGRYPFIVVDTMEFRVKGILKENVFGSYGIFNDADIFMPIEDIQALQEKYLAKEEVQTLLQQKMQEKATHMRNFEGKEYYLITKMGWEASALVINVDNPETIYATMAEIENIDPDYVVSLTQVSVGSIDKNITNQLKKSVLLYSCVIIVGETLGIVVINYFQLRSRKNDFTFLYRNGVSKSDVQSIEFKEMIYKTGIGVLMSLLMTYLCLPVVADYIVLPIHFTFSTVLMNSLLYSSIVLISYSISQAIVFRK